MDSVKRQGFSAFAGGVNSPTLNGGQYSASSKAHYVNWAEYQRRALNVGAPGPVATSVGPFHPALPVDRRRRTRLALQLASWCQRQRCLLCSLAGERRELTALPKRQGVGDRRPSKEISALAEPLPDEGVQ